MIFLELFTMAPIVKSANFEGAYLGRYASDRETVNAIRCGSMSSVFRDFNLTSEFLDLSYRILVDPRNDS